jgi:hypothetical protein
MKKNSPLSSKFPLNISKNKKTFVDGIKKEGKEEEKKMKKYPSLPFML